MRIEVYFDFSCPYAYLAVTRIEELAAEAGAAVVWRPMLLGGVFRALGQEDSLPMGPAKARHNLLDMHRWAEIFDVPLRMPAAHPMRTVRALRALLALHEPGWPAVIHSIYRAYWQQGIDIATAGGVRAALEAAGVHGHALERAIAANDDPAVKADLRARTEEAVSRGVFGAPTMFVHAPGETEPLMFWGQDRLHMVRAALHGWRPTSRSASDIASEYAQIRSPAHLSSLAAGTPRTLHFWYDFSSPYSYLAAARIERVARDAGARLRWRPMLLGGLFRDIGTPNVPLLAMPRARSAYMYRDLAHWAAFQGVPFAFPRRFPQRTITALRLALVAGDRVAELSHALFRVMWVDGGNLEHADTLARVLAELGLDPAAMLARTQDGAVKQMLIDSTAEAARAGVFGAPTCVVEDERGDMLFWGQDRLELADAALRGWRPRAEDQISGPPSPA